MSIPVHFIDGSSQVSFKNDHRTNSFFFAKTKYILLSVLSAEFMKKHAGKKLYSLS